MLINSFRDLAHLYLEPNGVIKEEAISHFLAQLPTANGDLKNLFRKRYGSHMKWEPLGSGVYNGYSGDFVAKISADGKTYFCKVFLCPKRGIREYLAYLYITEWNPPLLKHAPVLEIGKILQPDGTEQIYLLSAMAKGLKGIEHIQALLQETGDITLLKPLLETLGNALSTTHKQKTHTFSKEELSTALNQLIQLRLTTNLSPLLQKLSEDPLLSSCYENFQTSLNTLITHHKTGHLCLMDTFFANYLFLPENGYLELIDQGDILLRLSSDQNYYWFAEDEIVNVLMLLHLLNHFRDVCLLPHLKKRFPIFRRFRNYLKHFVLCNLFKLKIFNKLRINDLLFYPKKKITERLSPEHLSSLRQAFLNAYYPNGFPSIDIFYEKTDFWMRLLFLILFQWSLSDDILFFLAKQEYLLYQKDPKDYIAKWFT